MKNQATRMTLFSGTTYIIQKIQTSSNIHRNVLDIEASKQEEAKDSANKHTL